MAKRKVTREQEEVRFSVLKNSKLVCKNCIFKSSDDLKVLSCDVYTCKPVKVLEGGVCDGYQKQ